jgi:3-methyladenine DNA glycosylase/8-oxoguanine DNA glycosylase
VVETNPVGAWSIQFPLLGPSGEPVNLERTFRSHGLASLPPMRLGEDAKALEVTLPVYGFLPRTVLVSESGPEHGVMSSVGPPPGREEGERIFAAVRRVLRLDEDLSGFYALATEDPDLSWGTKGAGRMVQSPTVFEEVVKTLCTTNCAWSATTRMVSALVEHLGEKAPEAPPTGPWGRAFPTPEAMAGAGEEFYRNIVRAGYRRRYLLALSSSVAGGKLDLESLDAPPEKLPDGELEQRLLALPGIGPYAAAHVMMMLGRYSRLILDSWTRPTYAQLVGKPSVADEEIEERFSSYGPYKGLAFWLYLTRGWIEEDRSAALRAF